MRDGYAVADVGDAGSVSMPIADHPGLDETLRVAIRPERIVPTPVDSMAASTSDCHLLRTITSVNYLGPVTEYLIETNAVRELTRRRMSEDVFTELMVGSRVMAMWSPEAGSVERWPVEEPLPA